MKAYIVYSGKGGVGKTTTTVGAEEIALNLKEGYSISKDGRYIPPEEVLGELHDMFGHRVGITSQYKEVRNSILAY